MQRNKVISYDGKPVESLTREELIEALNQVSLSYQELHNRYIKSITDSNKIKRRNLLSRLLRFPYIFIAHYRILRKSNSIRSSLVASIRLSKAMFKFCSCKSKL